MNEKRTENEQYCNYHAVYGRVKITSKSCCNHGLNFFLFSKINQLIHFRMICYEHKEKQNKLACVKVISCCGAHERQLQMSVGVDAT